MKKIFTLFGTLIILLIISNPVLAEPRVILDGQPLTFDVPPIIEDGRTLVPLRTIFEALCVTISWDENTQTVTATKDEKNIKLQINSKTAYKNNQAISLDVAPKIINGRTLVPLRFISESLDANVDWNNDNQTVTIINNNRPNSENSQDELDEENQVFNLVGNSSGNIQNCGYASQEQGWIYFSTYNSGLLKMRLDGTDFNSLTEDRFVSNINVKDGWIYYTCWPAVPQYDENKIQMSTNRPQILLYKIKPDGSEKTLLFSGFGSLDSVIVIKDWIYGFFRPENNEPISRGYIAKIKTDGSEKTILSEDDTQTLYYDDGWFYTDQYYVLSKMKIDGSEVLELNDVQPVSIAVTNDWIFYQTVVNWANQTFASYKIKKDGTHKQKLEEGIRINYLNYSGEWLYYTVGDPDGGSLYKMRPDATDKTLILDEKVAFINIVGDWIIYRNGYYGEIRRIKTDGTNNSRLVNGIWEEVNHPVIN